MSLWDSITSAAASAYDKTGSALSSAYSATESVAGGLLKSATMAVSNAGDSLVAQGYTVGSMDPAHGPMQSAAPDSPAAATRPGKAILLVVTLGALLGLYLTTRKKP